MSAPPYPLFLSRVLGSGPARALLRAAPPGLAVARTATAWLRAGLAAPPYAELTKSDSGWSGQVMEIGALVNVSEAYAVAALCLALGAPPVERRPAPFLARLGKTVDDLVRARVELTRQEVHDESPVVTVELSDADAARACKACGAPQHGVRGWGCHCLRDLSKAVTAERLPAGWRLSLDPEVWTPDAVAILQAVRRG